ncbi:MAG: ABC transporter ATP-binding protein [Clostridia bacterium]|nr:ABC transporter ATP-binding protein [Clostridia bacterium]
MSEREIILEVSGLTKEYPGFLLDGVGFTVARGEIVGFIGRNGAGKSTTLKSILHLVHPASGTIRYFGMDFAENERAVRQRIGFAAGAVDFYKRRRIREIRDVAKIFYDDWEEEAWTRCIREFELDENKRPAELSEGMKVKLNLALALSHRAELLILDEPTSGLDPFSRAELLDLFRELAGRGAAILYSTHVISDLEKCADRILYIRRGRIADEADRETFKEKHRKDENESLEDMMVRMEKEGKERE